MSHALLFSLSLSLSLSLLSLSLSISLSLSLSLSFLFLLLACLLACTAFGARGSPLHRCALALRLCPLPFVGVKLPKGVGKGPGLALPRILPNMLLVNRPLQLFNVKLLSWPKLSYFELAAVGSSKGFCHQSILNVLQPPLAPWDDGICHGVIGGLLA